MTALRLSLAFMCGLLAACGGPQPPAFDAMLVDRFDVGACGDIQPLRMAGQRDGENHKVTREYKADAECMSALEKAALALDFEKGQAGNYIAHRDDGWSETLIVGRSKGDSGANVIWEEINP